MIHGEIAVDFFSSGYNCAQSTAVAFAKEAGLEEQALLNLVAGFGGGLGGLRETCGAVNGMVCALSLFHGTYDPQDNESKTELYKNIRAAIEEFKEKFGTTCCKELLQKAGCIPKPDPSVRNAEYYSKRPCSHFVKEAALIAARRRKIDQTVPSSN